jgi:glucose-6-phosphate 1-dehydrogenase
MLPIQPTDVVRGQYNGYRREEGVSPDSDTETFIALRSCGVMSVAAVTEAGL